MSTGETEAPLLSEANEATGRKQRIFAAGGAIGAILASTCCVVPLILVTLGISGAWIGNLTALEPYKPYFGTVALIFIGLGFREVYFNDRQPACAEDSYCAKPASSVVNKTVLWLSTVVVLLALTIGWWAPFFY